MPRDDPGCDHQANRPGRTQQKHMPTCLIVGLQKATHTAINYDKLREVSQGPDKNSAQFLLRLTETLQKYTKIEPASNEGTVVLNTHFISQSAPDIRKKTKNRPKRATKPLREVSFLWPSRSLTIGMSGLNMTRHKEIRQDTSCWLLQSRTPKWVPGTGDKITALLQERLLDLVLSATG